MPRPSILLTCCAAAFVCLLATAPRPPATAADEAQQEALAAEKRALPAALAEKIDYAKDVQPILAANCYSCHGPEKQESGLRLHAKTPALAGGDNGLAIKPKDAANSPLVLRVAGLGDDGQMPPADEGKPLSQREIAVLRTWIDQGAAWPDDANPGAATQTHWAYRKPSRPALPEVKNAAWPRTPIDRFILARLERENLGPSDETDRARLLRRASLDLVGLPPSMHDVETFSADASPDAFERAVDRLLASPRYGERWGAMWLDLARYADTQGYEKDNRRTIWRYRDWVIAAFNANMPFDQFTVEQLAGDLLPGATADQVLATAFHRNTMTNTEGGTDNEEFRVAAVVDRVNTTWAVWMGSTFGCCQCHSHKYDPFTQREYYEFFAFLDQTEDRDADDEAPTVPMPTDAQTRELARLQEELAAAEWGLTAFAAPPTAGAIRAPEPMSPEHVAARARVEAVKKQIAAVQPPRIPVMRELPPAQARKTHFMNRGNFLNKGDVVSPGVPQTMHPFPADLPRNRLGMARWIVSPENPLAGRVLANRLWDRLFGLGIVETTEDFGTQGAKPSHPQLLDYLAVDAIDRGWDVKAMLRQMTTSAVYRQSSRVSPQLAERDGYNRLLARAPRIRLSAEQVRDQALAISGLLSTKMHGPSVMPPQPDGVWQVVYSGDQWVTPTGDDRYRRGLYTFWRRTAPHPAMTAFDAPSREFCVLRRPKSNTPLQALVTLNDPAHIEAAQAMARRIVAEGGAGLRDRLAFAIRATLAREAAPGEIDRLAALWESERAHFQQHAEAAKKMAASHIAAPAGGDIAEMAAWTVVANVLFNLDETVTRG